MYCFYPVKTAFGKRFLLLFCNKSETSSTVMPEVGRAFVFSRPSALWVQMFSVLLKQVNSRQSIASGNTAGQGSGERWSQERAKHNGQSCARGVAKSSAFPPLKKTTSTRLSPLPPSDFFDHPLPAPLTAGATFSGRAIFPRIFQGK